MLTRGSVDASETGAGAGGVGAGAGGAGELVVSLSRWAKESSGRVVSVFVSKSWRGREPVDENKETVLGCTEDENML